MSGNLFVVGGSVHDQLETEGAAEVSSENAAAISIVAANIDDIVLVADNIDDDLASIPANVAAAAASATAAANSATEAQAAAASTVGIDTAAQAHALAAQTAATAAEAHAATASANASEAAQTVDGIGQTVVEAEAAAALAERWANEIPGVEVTPGKFGSPHYLAQHEALLATAPNIQCRVFGSHAGEAGADGITQTFSNIAADFGRAIIVRRLANRPTKLKLAGTLFTGPPKQGSDEALAPLYVINHSGAASYCEIEGPGDPTTGGTQVLKPAVIAQGIEVLHDTTLALPATTITVELDIPAGSNRKFVAIGGVIFHTVPVGVPDLTCAAATGITQRGTAGNGNQASGAPILSTMWTGDIPGSAAVDNAQFGLVMPAGLSGAGLFVKVLQNVSAMEDYAVVARAGAALTETQDFSPSQAGSVIVAFAFHQGAGAQPVGLSPNDTIEQGKTPGSRPLKDYSYALIVDADRPASLQTYTGSSGFASPAVIGGLVFLPVTQTTGGSGDDNMVWKGTRPARLDPGQHAAIFASSDGLTYYLDTIE